MIRIHTAKPATSLAYTASGFGPFSPDGSELFEEFSMRSGFDELRDRPGIYGENHVNHRQIFADIYANPWSGVYSLTNNLVRVYAKTSSGGWSTGYTNIYECNLWPAHPWVNLTWSSSRHFYVRKTSPNHMEKIEVYWRRVLGRYELDRVYYYDITCSTPGSGSAKPISQTRYWFAIWPTSDISLPVAPTKSSMDLLLPRIRDLMVSSYSPKLSTKTENYAYYSKLKTGEELDVSRVLSLVSGCTDDHYKVPDDVRSFGELAGEAVDTLDSNTVNMFEFLQGFKNPKDLVPKLRNLSKLKTHAGNHLAVQYGILPTISDLETLKDAILGHAKPYFDRNNYQVLTAGHSVSSQDQRGSVVLTNRVKIALNNADPKLFTLSERLRNIGGFPSVDNLWDLVPYSFVVDWFINVGDMLEGIDDRFRISQLPVVYATTSSKLVITPQLDKSLTALGCYGDAQIVFYDRSVSHEAPTPPLNFEVSNELPANWLEAGALIVTARHK